MQPQLRNKLLANIDVTAAETFFAKDCSKQKVSIKTIEASLLEATQKFLEPLGIEGDCAEVAEHSRIDFKKLAESEKATAAVVGQEPRSSAATVSSFDERTGEQLNQQLQFPEVAKGPRKSFRLPW